MNRTSAFTWIVLFLALVSAAVFFGQRKHKRSKQDAFLSEEIGRNAVPALKERSEDQVDEATAGSAEGEAPVKEVGPDEGQ